MTNTLINYIRDNNGNPQGVVVAIRKGDEVFYGFSKCSPKDKWNRELGINIAIARANAGAFQVPLTSKSANQIFDAIKHISNRAVKYFKDIPAENIQFMIK